MNGGIDAAKNMRERSEVDFSLFIGTGSTKSHPKEKHCLFPYSQFKIEQQAVLFFILCIQYNFFPFQVFANRNTITTVSDLRAAIQIINAGKAISVMGKNQ